MRNIIPISGKDSLATAIVQRTIDPELDYEFVFNPTGAELPEVLTWIDKVEGYLGKEIIKVGANLNDIIESYNYFLPNGQSRYCTRQAKIEPFISWINGESAKVYYGIRADENRQGFNNSTSPNILPVYPLQEMGVNLSGVYDIINTRGLKPPTFFWKSVYEEVCRIIGTDVRFLLPEWYFDMLFAWRSRANCYFCFNQRLYELVGLLEHHPDLFDIAESYEYKGGDNPYYWKKDYPLKKIRENADRIKKKRINTICKIIAPKMILELFEEEDFFDILELKSCGLFCGK
ncbi:phosphoadenosine phosphosulfate reductase domain-containing protein [Chryseobacterium mulctrae]|uniref:phosphoadenosine phosphosulfate reductase domain-containing protein n=1 Tax=Chryseobacterium mulctrae TaxID=2576777 RepID=UPI0011164EA5|nr:phosphoadenosine phosphosulfate reductase family protein [Chryseobacterium mulctrae]